MRSAIGHCLLSHLRHDWFCSAVLSGNSAAVKWTTVSHWCAQPAEDPTRQAFIDKVVHSQVTHGSGCIFTNIKALNCSAAECAAHHKQCPVCYSADFLGKMHSCFLIFSCFLLCMRFHVIHSSSQVPQTCKLKIVGWSCKDLSKLSKFNKTMHQCMKDGSGSTGETFAGLMAHLRAHPTGIIIGESVEDLADQ